MKSLNLAKHKVEFLLSKGFKLIHEPVERHYSGTISTMQVWELATEYHYYTLYIWMDDSEPNHCELFYGKSDGVAEVFSERNLISELNKRITFD